MKDDELPGCDPVSREAYCAMCKLCGGESWDTEWCNKSRWPDLNVLDMRGACDNPSYDPLSDPLSWPLEDEHLPRSW